jgi:hypothetical protein
MAWVVVVQLMVMVARIVAGVNPRMAAKTMGSGSSAAGAGTTGITAGFSIVRKRWCLWGEMSVSKTPPRDITVTSPGLHRSVTVSGGGYFALWRG